MCRSGEQPLVGAQRLAAGLPSGCTGDYSRKGDEWSYHMKRSEMLGGGAPREFSEFFRIAFGIVQKPSLYARQRSYFLRGCSLMLILDRWKWTDF